MLYVKAVGVGVLWAVAAVVLLALAVFAVGWIRWQVVLWRQADVAGSGGIGLVSGGVNVVEVLIAAIIGFVAGAWRTLK